MVIDNFKYLYVFIRIKMLSKKDIIEINKLFSNGALINESSLDYVVNVMARSRNWLKASAHFTRAILIDHIFEDGNKRTAAAAIMLIMDLNKIPYDPQAVTVFIITVLKKNMVKIKEIERCMKDVIR